jgi:regulator of protease activity HflC (stomatin/prohibitin superfamily)
LIIPFVDTIGRFVDQRVRVASVTAESTLTRDTVPVNLDAVVFWLVWNAEKFARASIVYQDNPIALHLRAVNMLYEEP